MKLKQKFAIGYIRTKLRMLGMVSKKKAAIKAWELFSTPNLKGKVHTTSLFDKGEKLRFIFENYTICGYRWKPKQAPLRKILILHGFESTCKKFSTYISAFLRKGYEVLAFDAPAHGESSGKQISLPLYTRTIKEIYTKYGPIHSFLAHSFGGSALAHFLEDQPHDALTKVVLIAPATETQTAIDQFFRLLKLDEGIRKEFDALILEKTGKQPEYFSIRRAVKHITVPILWIHDEKDDITPVGDVWKVQQADHPNIQFVFTQGLGHRKIYHDEAVVERVVDFL